MIELRRAIAADALAVAEVYLASFHATYDFPLAHTDAEVREWVAVHVIGALETWVAVDEQGQPIGFLALSDESIEQLYVSPDRTGEGIGSRLLEVAKQRRTGGLDLWTFLVNEGARRFYERHGFTAVEFGDGSGNEEGQPDVRYE